MRDINVLPVGNDNVVISIGDHHITVTMVEFITLRNLSTPLINELQEPVVDAIQGKARGT